MEIKDVKVWSGVNATVGLTAPTVNLRKTWEKKGSFQKIPFDALQQAMYEPGVDFLFKTGALYIKEKEINIALGLIDEDEPNQLTEYEKVFQVFLYMLSKEFLSAILLR